MSIPLTKPYFTSDEIEAVSEVIKSGWIMQGEKVAELEEKLSGFIGSKYGVLVSSGTAALHLALLSQGIGLDDKVIVPSFSFVASANAILYTEATPIFVDIDPGTFNMDPSDIEKKITPNTKAIMIVHQIGLSANMDKIMEIAKRKKLIVIEDAACALGATYKGRGVGTFGAVGCFSFHPRKSITTAEGGLIVTSDQKTYEILRSLRNHGLVGEKAQMLGFNYRMTDIQAAMGLAQFKKLKEVLQERRELALRYNSALGDVAGIKTPSDTPGSLHTYQSYMLRITGGRLIRDKLITELKAKGIASRAGLTAIHKEPLYVKLFGKLVLPETDRAGDEGLILPLYPQMTAKEQDFVIDTLKSLLDSMRVAK